MPRTRLVSPLDSQSNKAVRNTGSLCRQLHEPRSECRTSRSRFERICMRSCSRPELHAATALRLVHSSYAFPQQLHSRWPQKAPICSEVIEHSAIFRLCASEPLLKPLDCGLLVSNHKGTRYVAYSGLTRFSSLAVHLASAAWLLLSLQSSKRKQMQFLGILRYSVIDSSNSIFKMASNSRNAVSNWPRSNRFRPLECRNMLGSFPPQMRSQIVRAAAESIPVGLEWLLDPLAVE